MYHIQYRVTVPQGEGYWSICYSCSDKQTTIDEYHRLKNAWNAGMSVYQVVEEKTTYEKVYC